MTQEQIKKYEACKGDLARLKDWKKKLPFGHQNHGCGSRDPQIYFELEKIHRDMYNGVNDIIDKAIEKVETKICEI